MMRVELHYFAAARAARGRNSEILAVERDATVTQALEAILRAHEQDLRAGSTPEAVPQADPRDSLGAVFGRCSFLVNAAASSADSVLNDGDRVDVLPPFAGG